MTRAAFTLGTLLGLALGCCFGMILGLEAASSGRPRPEGYDDVVFTS